MKKRVVLLILSLSSICFAQTELSHVPSSHIPGFWEFLFSASPMRSFFFLSMLIVLMTAIVLSVKIFHRILTVKTIPETLEEKLEDKLENGDLNGAVMACEQHPCAFSSMLLAGFDSVSGGYDAVLTAVSVEASVIQRKMMRNVRLLCGCALLAFGFGVLTAVSGICSALVKYSGGDITAQVLPLRIASSLSALALGIMIALPVCIVCFIADNGVSRVIVRLEELAHKRIRVLSNARTLDSGF